MPLEPAPQTQGAELAGDEATASSPSSMGLQTPAQPMTTFGDMVRSGRTGIFTAIPRDDELVHAVETIVLRQATATESVNRSRIQALLSLPYRVRHEYVAVCTDVDLACVVVAGGRTLQEAPLHRRLSVWLAEGSSATDPTGGSAGSRRRTPSQIAAADARRGIRLPDLAIVAEAESSSEPRPYTISAVVEVKKDEDSVKAGLAQAIYYAALMNSLSGGKLGMFVLGNRFVRLFALANETVALELDLSDKGTSVPLTQSASSFIARLRQLSCRAVANRLPWDLKAAPDAAGTGPANWQAVEILGTWTVAAHQELLELPVEGPFPRFPASPDLLGLHGCDAAAVTTLPLGDEAVARPIADFARRELRRKAHQPAVEPVDQTPHRSHLDASGDGAHGAGGDGVAGPAAKRLRADDDAAPQARRVSAEAGASTRDMDDDGWAGDDEQGAATAADSDEESDADEPLSRPIPPVALPLSLPDPGSDDDGYDAWALEASDASLPPEQFLEWLAHSGLRVVSVSSAEMDQLVSSVAANATGGSAGTSWRNAPTATSAAAPDAEPVPKVLPAGDNNLSLSALAPLCLGIVSVSSAEMDRLVASVGSTTRGPAQHR